MTKIEELKASLDNVEQQIRVWETQKRRIDLAIAECEGDTLRAEWLRLVLDGSHDAAHAAWVRMMASREGMREYLAGEERDRDAIREAMAKAVKP